MPSTNRVPIPVLICAVVLASTACTALAQEAEPLTTVILVRHAEKVLSGDNPVLVAEGTERARRLAYHLGSLDVDAVYSTRTKRTLATAEPLAMKLGVTPTKKEPNAAFVATVAAEIREHHAGHVVVVVGHSDTTPKLARELGAENVPDIPESDYDNLFIVTFAENAKTRFLNLRY